MPRSAALVGRSDELARLVDVAEAVASDESGCRFVVVTGEAGIGKTRLVDELCATVAARDRVLRGRAEEHTSEPFAAWLPVLAVLGLRRPAPDDWVPAGEQRWEVVDMVASAVPRGALIVLEDMHWSDDDALWVLEQLLDRCSSRALAVVATARPEQTVAAPRWSALYRRAEVVALGGLATDEVATLVAHLGSTGVDAAALRERTGGNPLFVREQVLNGKGQTPASIEPLLRSSIDQLGGDAAQVVTAIALAEPGTPRSVIAAAVGVAPDVLDRLIGAAVAADILRVDGGRVLFRHDLLAEAAAHRVGDGERARLHLALAGAHERDGGPDADQAAARHRLLAVPTADAAVAADAASAAAERLRSDGRVAPAAALLELAGRVLADVPDVDPRIAATVAVGEAEARWALDDYDAGREAGARAVELAGVADDPVLAARALLAATAHPNPFVPDPEATERIAALDDLLHGDEGVDAALRVRLRIRRATLTATLPDRVDEAIALADDAVAAARLLDDPDLLVAVLGDRHFVVRTPADHDARAEAAAEVIALARRGRRPDLARLGHEWTYADRAHRADLAGAIAALDDLELLAAVMPSPRWRYGVAVRRASVLGLLGDYESALAIATTARSLAAGVVDDREADGLDLSLRALAGALYGRDDHGVAPVLERVLRSVGHVPVLFLQATAAFPEGLLGDLGAARRRVAPWTGRFAVALDGPEGLSALSALAHIATMASWREAAVELRRLLAPFAGRMAAGGADVSIDHHLGALALVVDDVEAALAHAQDAVALARRSRSPLLQAHALTLLATAGDRGGDPATAASARDAARALAEPLGVRIHETGDRPPRDPRPQTARGPGDRTVVVRLDGGRWWVRSPFGQTHVADSAGMKQLIHLVTHPGVEVPAMDLAVTAHRRPMVVSSDLGPALDARAKREYRRWITELQEEIDEAEAHNDLGRAAKHRVEMDAILEQLRAAVGIGGRDRPQGSGSERARVNAARTIRRAIAALAQEVPDLGAHLDVSIRTGHRCAYAPEPAAALTWTVEAR